MDILDPDMNEVASDSDVRTPFLLISSALNSYVSQASSRTETVTESRISRDDTKRSSDRSRSQVYYM